jgi:putative endonuclease
MNYYTYIMASGKNGTLYIGMTNDLIRRVWEHKNHCVDGFTGRYDVTDLVWYEIHSTAENAIKREKRLKRYQRQWKISLIEENNPQWHDLYDDIAKP